MTVYLRLARSGQPGFEKPGIVFEDDMRRDISVLTTEIDRATLSGPWCDSLMTVLSDTLPAVAPDARLAVPIDRVGRTFRTSGSIRDARVDIRLGDPAGPRDSYDRQGLGDDFSVVAGIAVIMAGADRISGLSLFADIKPVSWGDTAQARVRGSRHGLWALGPYILALDEFRELRRATIRLSIRCDQRPVVVRHTVVESGDIETMALSVGTACPLEAGDVILVEARDAPFFTGRLAPGDRVEVSGGRFGTQSRLIA